MRPQYVDYLAERVHDAVDDLLTVLTAYRYEEALAVIEWVKAEASQRAVIRGGQSSANAESFPIKLMPQTKENNVANRNNESVNLP